MGEVANAELGDAVSRRFLGDRLGAIARLQLFRDYDVPEVPAGLGRHWLLRVASRELRCESERTGAVRTAVPTNAVLKCKPDTTLKVHNVKVFERKLNVVICL